VRYLSKNMVFILNTVGWGILAVFLCFLGPHRYTPEYYPKMGHDHFLPYLLIHHSESCNNIRNPW